MLLLGYTIKNVLDKKPQEMCAKTFMFSQLEKASMERYVIYFSVSTRNGLRVGRFINFMASTYHGGVDLMGQLNSWHREW